MSERAPDRADSSDFEVFQMMAWRWNITTAKKLASARAPQGRIEPTEWAGMLRLVAIDPHHAAEVDLSEPLIVATVPNGGMLIIDGWHRLYKALTMDVAELPAVVLTAEEELACRIFGGEKGQGYLR
ncbi:ParB N-terminal domain-containing protein [Nonomuraea bangladeshensis]|uniref:ParB N-terminal domain-containing protein n=1 Tax=Nonomuraea bangladeshensis TaxID=404385 RepID=A0ABV3GYV2_9ACTN